MSKRYAINTEDKRKIRVIPDVSRLAYVYYKMKYMYRKQGVHMRGGGIWVHGQETSRSTGIVYEGGGGMEHMIGGGGIYRWCMGAFGRRGYVREEEGIW